GTDPVPPAREPEREHTTDALDLAVQRQLAHHRERADAPVLDYAGGLEDAERDREIERGTLLADVRGREVHRDAVVRKCVAGVPDRGADALAAFADSRVGKTDRVERRQS